MTTLADLNTLIEANEDAFESLTVAYQLLLGGVPNIDGYVYLLDEIERTNYGSLDTDVIFNRENAFINVANALVTGDTKAATYFQALLGWAKDQPLTDQISVLYYTLAGGTGTEEGLAYLTRSEALSYYEQVAVERGVGGDDAAALVAFGAIASIIVGTDLDDKSLIDDIGDLRMAIADGSAQLPQSGSTFTDIEDADGTNYDDDDTWVDVLPLPDTPGIEFVG